MLTELLKYSTTVWKSMDLEELPPKYCILNKNNKKNLYLLFVISIFCRFAKYIFVNNKINNIELKSTKIWLY